MYKNILCLHMLLLINGVSGQQNLDSLYSVWEDEEQIDSIRIASFSDYIFYGYMFSKPDSALIFTDQLLDFTDKKDINWAKARAFSLKGTAYSVKSDYEKALEAYFGSLEISRKADLKKEVALTLGSIGRVHQEQGNYILALQVNEECLTIATEINNKIIKGKILNSFGIIYSEKGAYEKALDYFRRSLKIAEDTENKREIAASSNNIGIMYHRMEDHNKALQIYHKALKIQEEIENKVGMVNALTNIALEHELLEAYDSANIYYQRSLKITKDIGYKYGTGYVLHNQGFLYKYLQNYDKALINFEESLKIMQEIGEQKNSLRSLIAIGTIDYEKWNYKKSISSCLSALKQAEELEFIEEQKLACECLYDGYKAIGNSQNALTYHEQMLVLNDSLKLQEISKKLQQMEFAKQVMADSLIQVEKDLQVEMVHQVEVRKKDKNRNLALGASIFFLVLSGGLYSRWRYVKKSKAIIEKEKDRSENLLLNILPAEIAEELKEKGQAEARDFDLVSILFTDFKGFTQASEKLTAQELIGEINHCFKAFDHICEKYGIEKIKTIGDAYMAAGGLPVPTDTSVKNTVMAALEMQDFIVALKAEKEQANKIFFEMRVGVHTGPVVAGIVGVKKFQYDIWGDTVNTASRMESSGEIGKVNISEDTFKLLQNNPEMTFTERGKVQAKGKGQLKMYFVENKT